MATLDAYMTASFAGAQHANQTGANWYRSTGQPNDNTYNCFAYAVGVTGRRINSQTRAQLTDEYNRQAFFEVLAAGAPLPGDVEVYTRPSEPNQIVHAHRVVTATSARSKLGQYELIDHHRNTLQAPKPGHPNSYEYGQVAMRFRRDETQYKNMFETTRSGRLVRKRAATDDNKDPAKKPKNSSAASASKPAAKPAARTATKPTAKPVKK